MVSFKLMIVNIVFFNGIFLFGVCVLFFILVDKFSRIDLVILFFFFLIVKLFVMCFVVIDFIFRL